MTPSGLSSGWAALELVSGHDSTLRSGGSLFVHEALWVSSVHPLVGPVSGGTRVGVFGSHFRESSTLVCRFELSSATVVARYMSAGRVECSAGVSAGVGARAMEVSLNGQQFSSSGVQYTYMASASVSSVWPSVAISEASTSVTV